MVANTFSPYLAPEPGMATSNATASITVPGSIMIIGATALAMGVWPLALGVAGWTAGGVAAGSIAAGAQAAIGNVVAGSAFAVAQSAAMGGAAAGVVNGVIAGTGAGAAAVAQWYGNCGKEHVSEEQKPGEKEEL